MKLRIIAVLAALLFAQQGVAEEIVLITNKSNTITSLSPRDAQNIFLGKKSKWDNGSPVVAFTQSNQTVTEQFTRAYVNKSANQFALYWRKAIFTGTGTPPGEVSDSVSMKESVASRPGTLGYILASEVDDSVAVVSIL